MLSKRQREFETISVSPGGTDDPNRNSLLSSSELTMALDAWQHRHLKYHSTSKQGQATMEVQNVPYKMGGGLDVLNKHRLPPMHSSMCRS